MRWRLSMKVKVMTSLVLLFTLFLTGCSKNSSHDINGYVEGRYTYISSPVAGALHKLIVNRGDKITKGEGLFKLDPNPELEERNIAQANYQSAKAKLDDLLHGKRFTVVQGILAQRAQASASLKLSAENLARYQKLHKMNIISKELFDKENTDYKNKLQRLAEVDANLADAKLGARKNQIIAQEAMVKSAEANLREIEWKLNKKTMVSPAAGVVYDTFFQQGEYVQAGQPVLALLLPQDVHIIFFVSESTLVKIKMHQAIRFHCDNGQWHNARIEYISSQAEYTPPVIYSQTSRSKLVYRIEASIPLKTALNFHPGQPVSIHYD